MTVRYTTSLEGITADSLRGGFWVGWPQPPSAELHLAMLRGSEVVVLAIAEESDTVVGFVNAVGDGVLAAYVPCLEVLPTWQGQGIGAELVRRVLAELAPRYMVDLVCDDDVVPFYQRMGFVPYRAMIRRDRSAILSSGGRFAPQAAPHDPDHERGLRERRPD